MARVIDASGGSQQIEPKLEWYRSAADAGQSLQQWANTNFATDVTKYGTAYNQILASEGIFIKPNREFGIHATRMADIMDGRPQMQGGAITKSSEFATAALRTLFPSAILTAIEDRLINNLLMNPQAFSNMVAVDDVIVGDKFERPLLNYSKVDQRSQAVAQLAEPTNMMTLTTSSVSKTIPTLAIGLMISDQAKRATTLDLVALAMARQVAIERSARADEYLIAMLSGDADVGMASLSSLSQTVAAVTLDSAATTGITQLAWMKWLYRNSRKRMIDWVVTDLAGAMAIENRANKPTTYTDNPESVRIDSVLRVGNPTWHSNVNVFITDDSNWPSATVMGLDKNYAIHRVSSSSIAYTGVENFVLRRAEALRVDFGEIAYRLYDDAFDTLTYTP